MGAGPGDPDLLTRKAARVGFDWPDTDGPLAKVREEIDEVHAGEEGNLRDGRDGAPEDAQHAALVHRVVAVRVHDVRADEGPVDRQVPQIIVDAHVAGLSDRRPRDGPCA